MYPPPVKALLDSSVQKAIEEWRLIGLRDIENVDKILDKIKKELEGFIRKLRTQARNSQSSRICEFVEQYCKEFEKKVKDNLCSLCESQEKRRKSLDHCTIAFIGRSKAGKSTLWSVIAGTGFEGIGVGRQNTTRENREYSLGKIRLIDTPGVETPDGEELTKIAESVIDETDLICFVMTDNNQQESEFRFLEILRKRAKPFLILLNVKGNLISPIHKKRFLKNPNKSFSVEDKKALGGHIDRIRRYAEQFYGTSDFPIIPVQLLAVQLALQSSDHEESLALMEASRFFAFIDTIKSALLSEGTLRRSQKILSGTVAHIDQICISLEENVKDSQNFFKDMMKSLEKCIQKVETVKRSALSELTTKLSKTFRKLKAEIPSFAENYYGDSQESLNHCWEERSKCYETEIQKIEQNIRQQFLRRVQEIVKECEKDFILKSQKGLYSSFRRSSKLEAQKTTSLHGVLKWIAALFAGAAVISPANAVPLLAISSFSDISSSFSESKAKKRQRAIANIKKQLEKECNELKKDMESKKRVFDKDCQEYVDQVKDLLNLSRKHFEFFENTLKNKVRFLSLQSRFLNKYFAARILSFTSENPSELSAKEWLHCIDSVEHNVGKSIIISTTRKPYFDKLPFLESIIQEEIIIR